MKKKTLLEQAKSFTTRKREPDMEELEVVLAYLRGEITVRQAASVMHMAGAGNFTHRIASVLHWALAQKLITISLEKGK